MWLLLLAREGADVQHCTAPAVARARADCAAHTELGRWALSDVPCCIVARATRSTFSLCLGFVLPSPAGPVPVLSAGSLLPPPVHPPTNRKEDHTLVVAVDGEKGGPLGGGEPGQIDPRFRPLRRAPYTVKNNPLPGHFPVLAQPCPPRLRLDFTCALGCVWISLPFPAASPLPPSSPSSPGHSATAFRTRIWDLPSSKRVLLGFGRVFQE